jgi:hypothetical protein
MGRLRARIQKAEQQAEGLWQVLTLSDGRRVKYEPEDMLDAILAVVEGEDHPLLPYVERMDPNKGIPSLMRALAGEGDPLETEETDGN